MADHSRRTLLSLLGTGATLFIAGCQSDNSPETISPETARTSEDIKTSEQPPQVSSFELLTDKDTIDLPSVWSSENSVEELQTSISFNLNAAEQVNVTVSKNGEEWKTDEGTEISIQEILTLEDLRNGENTLTASLTQDNETVETRETTVRKETPESHLLDIKSANQKQSPIFSTYSSPDQLQHDKKTVNLEELEQWHDNDYENLSQQNPEMQTFVEAVGNENVASEIKENPVTIQYTNHDQVESQHGYYDEEEALNATSIGIFLDQTHRLLFNIEAARDSEPISTEDEQYVASLQEAADRYLKGRENLEDVETHFWSFDLPMAARSTHGNGFIWDETNDELRILETIAGPITKQLHPLIENSNYLEPGHEAFNQYWHPLRFDGTEPEKETLSFEDGKKFANELFMGIATGFQDEDIDNSQTNIEAGIGITTKYLTDVIEKFRNYNQNGLEFEEIKNQSKVYNKLRSENGNYILGGTVENPVFAEVEEDTKIQQIWTDQDGTLPDYVEDLDQQTYEEIINQEANEGMNTDSIRNYLDGMAA